MAPGPRPRGLPSRRFWRPDLAYAVGLLVTDGHVSTDGRHIVLVSKDVEQLETFKTILELKNRISRHSGGTGAVYHTQFGDRMFAEWLTSIGFTARKTYNIGSLTIPDEFFRDFLRGHLDGDGCTVVYTDRYNTKLKPGYVYQRLYVRFLSASRPHIEWLQVRINSLLGIDGYLTMRTGPLATVPLHTLHFAKKDAIKLLRWIYYSPDVPCLKRKRAIAEPFLTGDVRGFRHPPGFGVRETAES